MADPNSPQRKHRTPAAYGGHGWSRRTKTLREEIGNLWGACGVSTEWGKLKAVLLHRPSIELEGISNPNEIQFIGSPDPIVAGNQHDRLAQAYNEVGVTVHYVDPHEMPPPNLMFVADLMWMTPEGAILGRPASTIRAGEERFIARRLAALGIPILSTVRGAGTFEGADAAWLRSDVVILATGLRTNLVGANQVAALLKDMNVEVINVQLPQGTMHLMGCLRFLDKDLAVIWPGRFPESAIERLEGLGFTVLIIPDQDEAKRNQALNFVSLGPRQIMAASENPITLTFFKEMGVECKIVQVSELIKAAGGIGCLTGVLERETNNST